MAIIRTIELETGLSMTHGLRPIPVESTAQTDNGFRVLFSRNEPLPAEATPSAPPSPDA